MEIIRVLHGRALAFCGQAVAAVRPADLGRPTPCAGWDLERLLAHVIGQNHGFAAADDARVCLPEFTQAPDFPLRAVLGFHLLDSLVHGWDVAVSLHRSIVPDPELAAAGLAQARLVPDTARGAPAAPFARALAPSRTVAAGDWEQTLLLLGRDPAWRSTPTRFSRAGPPPDRP